MSADQLPVDYIWAVHNDPTVQSMSKQGATATEIIGMLAHEKRVLLNRIAALEEIAPRKTTLSNGRTMIWHCPDELIPEATK